MTTCPIHYETIDGRLKYENPLLALEYKVGGAGNDTKHVPYSKKTVHTFLEEQLVNPHTCPAACKVLVTFP